VDAEGVALWSEDEAVLGRVRAIVKDSSSRDGALVVTSQRWLEALETMIAVADPNDLRMLRAAAVLADGSFNAWRACGVHAFQLRCRTPWLPPLVNRGGFRPYFQPIVNVDTGGILGYESLVRAEVDGRLMNGGEIIDAARAHNALFQLDEQARVDAVRIGMPKLIEREHLFVNFLPMTVRNPSVCLASVWDAAKSVNADLTRLVFEVVESEAFPDLKHLRAILDEFRQRGSKVALDDLGTGNSALTYIDELAPDYIKLAKGLIPEQPRQDDLLLVRGLVDHAHLRGIRVIAEGIETERQFHAVQSLDIDYIQGWLVGKPEAEPRRDLGMERLRAA